MKIKQIRKITVGNNLVIKQICEGIIKTSGKELRELKEGAKKAHFYCQHTKKARRIFRAVVREQIDSILLEIRTSIANLENITKFPQEDIRLFFMDFFEKLAFT